ncbi:hypothetical protein GYMLUDRAFT_73582 [Collybiopsis luxurians FD-317 M1]|uniref:Rap1 Myb domain-containing protein n=1 Tax=Collybiopsis luxurians FD-317 M1 TaxID=944289 RepID=A0A0D0BZA7_9AGAR|nr:hypothetical protein GYMLUDRAFT_73582 [Collybiopsis luxurians FD-317 M1]
MTFTKDDDQFLVQFIARHNPDFRGRKGEILYKNLVQQRRSSHSWKSWQWYYIQHQDYFDPLVEKYQLDNGIPLPHVSGSTPTKKKYAFTEAEDEMLVEYIARNDLTGKRKGLHLYDGLAKRDRTAKAWCHRYSKNADYFDQLVDIYRRKHKINLHLLSTPESSTKTHSRPSLSAPSSIRFSREEDERLVAYLAENTSWTHSKGLQERKNLKVYAELAETEDTSRSALSLMSRYSSHMEYFERLIEQYRQRNRRTRLGKRKRADEEEDIAPRSRKNFHTTNPKPGTGAVDENEERELSLEEGGPLAVREQREEMYTLTSPTIRVTRSHMPQPKTQEDTEVHDMLEIDRYLREWSVSSVESDTQVASNSRSSILKRSGSRSAFDSNPASVPCSGLKVKVRVRFAYPHTGTHSPASASPAMSSSSSIPVTNSRAIVTECLPIKTGTSRSISFIRSRVRLPIRTSNNNKLPLSPPHNLESKFTRRKSSGSDKELGILHPPVSPQRQCSDSISTVLVRTGCRSRTVDRSIDRRKSLRLNPPVQNEPCRRTRSMVLKELARGRRNV